MGNHRKDLTGKTSGWLTALHPTGQQDRQGNCLWVCRCRCGKELVKRSAEFGKKPRREGQAEQSCGCNRPRVYSSKYGGAGHLSGHRFGCLQTQAKHRGHAFDVTIEYLWEKFVEQEGRCALSGVPLFLSKKASFPDETRASLDRISSELGYITGNVQWVHPAINFMKHAMDQTAFVTWCKRVAEHA
jgi:hypothetical protein